MISQGERRSGARGRSLWTPVGKPASLAFVLSDCDGADVNRHAKWTRIAIHEGPLSGRIRSGLISAEAAGRNDCLEFSEVEVADREQRLGGGAVL